MITRITQSFIQLFDLRIIKVLIFSALIGILVTSVLSFLLYLLINAIPIADIPWVGSWLSTSTAGEWALATTSLVVVVIFWLFVYPYVLLIMTSLYQDRIISIVEGRHYPNLPLPLNHRLREVITQQCKFILTAILVNIVFSPLYLVLMFTGFGAVLLAALINGYLIGVEYYSMVSHRRLTFSQHDAGLRKNRVTVHFYGVAIYFCMLVPFFSLLMPVLGCMIMTHLFYSHNSQNSFMTSPQE